MYNFGVRAIPEEGGQVNLNVAGKYQEGEQISLKALPNSELGYEFVDWTLHESIVSSESEYAYSMPASNVTLMANFAIPAAVYNLGVNALPEEGGNIVVRVDGEVIQQPYEIEEQTEVALEAVASDEYSFIEWQMGENTFTDNPLTITIENDLDITAVFELQTGVSEDTQNAAVSVFPNPASSAITIRAADMIESLQIVDLRGVVVLDQLVNKDEAVIDISGLSPGFYFLWSFSDSKRSVQKIQVKVGR